MILCFNCRLIVDVENPDYGRMLQLIQSNWNLMMLLYFKQTVDTFSSRFIDMFWLLKVPFLV